jgi:hypothetical protein
MRNNLLALVPLLERLTVIGMMAGVIGMFQPWDILWYGWGFIVLFISTLAFIVVSHLPVIE